mmetsp:Transcript_14246/g.39269  ORF Transcript_14246/g.39269 Transcript_14246/m.39269 type:complete len:461 (-) Transcript_14246:3594-4976(-)
MSGCKKNTSKRPANSRMRSGQLDATVPPATSSALHARSSASISRPSAEPAASKLGLCCALPQYTKEPLRSSGDRFCGHRRKDGRREPSSALTVLDIPPTKGWQRTDSPSCERSALLSQWSSGALVEEVSPVAAAASAPVWAPPPAPEKTVDSALARLDTVHGGDTTSCEASWSCSGASGENCRRRGFEDADRAALVPFTAPPADWGAVPGAGDCRPANCPGELDAAHGPCGENIAADVSPATPRAKLAIVAHFKELPRSGWQRTSSRSEHSPRAWDNACTARAAAQRKVELRSCSAGATTVRISRASPSAAATPGRVKASSHSQRSASRRRPGSDAAPLRRLNVWANARHTSRNHRGGVSASGAVTCSLRHKNCRIAVLAGTCDGPRVAERRSNAPANMCNKIRNTRGPQACAAAARHSTAALCVPAAAGAQRTRRKTPKRDSGKAPARHSCEASSRTLA